MGKPAYAASKQRNLIEWALNTRYISIIYQYSLVYDYVPGNEVDVFFSLIAW